MLDDAQISAYLSAHCRTPKADREVQRRPELEQSLLRVAIAFIVMVYLFWYTLRDRDVLASEIQVLAVSVGFFLFCVILAVRILAKEKRLSPAATWE